MACSACNTFCGSISPDMPPEGSGPILIVLDEVTSEQDFEGSYLAGPSGRLLTDVLKRAGLQQEICTITSAARCLGQADYDFAVLLRGGRFKSLISFGDESLKVLCKKSGIKDKRPGPFPLHASYGVEGDVWVTYGLSLVRKIPNYRNLVVRDIQAATGSSKPPESVAWKYWNASL